MSFSIPTFNLSCNVWNNPAAPPGAPTFSTPCNLAYGKRIHPYGPGASATFMSLLLPAGTDIRSPIQIAGNSYVECPAGSHRYYLIIFVDDVGKGFANEHRVAVLQQTTGFGFWPTPMP